MSHYTHAGNNATTTYIQPTRTVTVTQTATVTAYVAQDCSPSSADDLGTVVNSWTVVSASVSLLILLGRKYYLARCPSKERLDHCDDIIKTWEKALKTDLKERLQREDPAFYNEMLVTIAKFKEGLRDLRSDFLAASNYTIYNKWSQLSSTFTKAERQCQSFHQDLRSLTEKYRNSRGDPFPPTYTNHVPQTAGSAYTTALSQGSGGSGPLLPIVDPNSPAGQAQAAAVNTRYVSARDHWLVVRRSIKLDRIKSIGIRKAVAAANNALSSLD